MCEIQIPGVEHNSQIMTPPPPLKHDSSEFCVHKAALLLAFALHTFDVNNFDPQ